MSINKTYINTELEKLNYQNNIINERNKNNNMIIKLFGLLNILSIIAILFISYIEKEKTINQIIELSNKDKNKQNAIIPHDVSVIENNKNFSWTKLEYIGENEILMCQQNNIYKKILKFNLNELINPMKVLGKKKIRLGNKYDGGYVLLDDFDNIQIAYSLGISTEVSFDKELADRNIDIFMYDHTIENLPYKNPKFHWKKIGLTGKTTIKQKNMKSLDKLISYNGHSHEQNMILKLDIESFEWTLFESISSDILKQFKYIVGEFHFNETENINYYNILKKIQNTHQVFHLHCNNCGKIIDLYGYKICNLLEISYIKKEGYQFINDDSIYPINDLDYKNCNGKDLSYILNILNEINP